MIEKELKTTRLQVPISKSDKQEAEDAAKKMEMTLANWVRWALKQMIKRMENEEK